MTCAATREQTAVERINERLPPCLYVPFLQKRFPLFYMLSLLPQEARAFNTNKRCPFLCVAEIHRIGFDQRSQEGGAAGEEAGGGVGAVARRRQSLGEGRVQVRSERSVCGRKRLVGAATGVGVVRRTRAARQEQWRRR